jgi:hypothetical protein
MKTTMKTRPILFSGAMVRAVLSGLKTQTRRVVKSTQDPCPYGAPGDRLWVRETWRIGETGVEYRADETNEHKPGNWKPSIFMRPQHSRITLEITRVRTQRLQDISLGDICAELGNSSVYDFAPVQDGLVAWEKLWDSINGKRPGCSWADNPLVWAISFQIVEARKVLVQGDDE